MSPSPPPTGRIVIVGAGIVGTMHAWFARRAGFEVVHLERDLRPRSATVRNFGLIWVSGRAPGDELDLALEARRLWEAIAVEAPGVGFRPDGSLTVARRPDELAVLHEVANAPEAAARQVEVLDPDATRRVNPALGGEFLGALWCRADAVVEPGLALGALRARLLAEDGYRFVGGRTAVHIGTGQVVDHTGEHHAGDLVLVCPGAEHAAGPMAELLEGAPLRRVMLQMCQTAPLGERLTTSVADGDSLRYYPAFDVPARASLDLAPEVVTRYAMQLLVSQRASGELTIGDTHHYDEPFDFACTEEPYDHLLTSLAALLGRPVPPVVRRWTGVYSQVADGAICWRHEPVRGVWIVTGPGGRGMTLSPAIARQTLTDHLDVSLEVDVAAAPPTGTDR